MNVPGWKEEFEHALDEMPKEQIAELLQTVKRDGLLEKFITDFGLSRLAAHNITF
jgi:hypothetical protein